MHNGLKWKPPHPGWTLLMSLERRDLALVVLSLRALFKSSSWSSSIYLLYCIHDQSDWSWSCIHNQYQHTGKKGNYSTWYKYINIYNIFIYLSDYNICTYFDNIHNTMNSKSEFLLTTKIKRSSSYAYVYTCAASEQAQRAANNKKYIYIYIYIYKII